MVCDGNYMDEVVDFLRKVGSYSINTVRTYAPSAWNQYVCFKPSDSQPATLYKGSTSYRVNPYSLTELRSADRRQYNAERIMYDIWQYGSVTATIKVFDPLKVDRLKQNFYLYKDGVYGYPWDGGDPNEYDGYHAICLIGWGEETIKGKNVKYWILRNSWGVSDWGLGGYCKFMRGENRAIVESDVWAVKI